MKLGIAHSTPQTARIISETVEQDPDWHVTWTASTGRQASENQRTSPADFILLETDSPSMDCVATTLQIMKESPVPILLITNTANGDPGLIFSAMGAGAIDVIQIPAPGDDNARLLLANKIRAVSSIHGLSSTPPAPLPSPPLIAIGSSAGGPVALSLILSQFPACLAAAIVIIQHLDAQFLPNLCSWLQTQTPLPIHLACDEKRPAPGEIHFAKPGHHLQLDPRGRFVHDIKPKNLSYRPSVDIFMHSVATHWKNRAAGVILTGMGRDGAEGLLAMRKRGFLTIAQEPQTATLSAMPQAAIKLSAAAEVRRLEDIPTRLVRFAGETAKPALS